MVQIRPFGAMNEINRDLFDHKFTNEMEFKSSFEKLKCFRIIDEDGNIINKPFENSIDNETLKKMYNYMVTMNEADVVFN